MLQRVIALSGLLSLLACSQKSDSPKTAHNVFDHERGNPTVILGERSSPQTSLSSMALKDSSADSESRKIVGQVRIALLYYLDSPAHRESVLAALSSVGATVLFEEPALGYLDAQLDWESLVKLQNLKSLPLDNSIFKVEVDSISSKSPSPELKPSSPFNSSFEGPVHEAAYGTSLEEFRKEFKNDFPERPSIEGEGITVAVFDSSIDISRTDVFDTRLRSYVYSDEDGWISDFLSKEEFLSKEGRESLPAELQDQEANSSLRFFEIDESVYGYDFNDNRIEDSFFAAVYAKEEDVWALRLRPHSRMSFGDELLSLDEAYRRKTFQSLDPRNAKFYRRAESSSGAHAMGFVTKMANNNGKNSLKLRLVGWGDGEHGIANLHMVGGKYKRGKTEFKGVAPKVDFIAVQPWSENRYGQSWIGLSRAMIDSIRQGADILDLDIYTPGTRHAQDLLSQLLCRITVTTQVIPIVAAHNFGPLPSTVQNLAQSPCVLTVGASYTVAASKAGYSKASTDPKHKEATSVWTTEYSGRGFALNGTLKPDIITPAYAYTAYGSEFTRFGGTSGATPATVGLVTLLQEASMAHLQRKLDFYEMKHLIQAGADPVADGRYRDGWGFTNILRSYQILRQKSIPSPLLLSGQMDLQFKSVPAERIHTLNLRRQSFENQINSVESMEFYIVFGGASTNTKHRWLKFYDRTQGKIVERLSWDAPMGGEAEELSLAFDLDAIQWAKLPVGDHLALVIGVRKSQLDQGAVVPDFVQPVSIAKGIETPSHTEIIRDLFVTQYRILEFSTQPGDVLLVSGQSHCRGKAHNTSPSTGFSGEALTLLVDNEKSYVSGSSVMNTYGPLKLTPTQTRIVARDTITRLAVLRGREAACEGPMDAAINVQKFSLGLEHSILSIDSNPKTHEVKGRLGWNFLSNPHQQGEVSASHKIKMRIDGTRLILTRRTPESLRIELNRNVEVASLRSVTGDIFPGVLAIEAEDGSWTESSPDSSGNHNRGFEINNGMQADQFLGLALRNIEASSILVANPSVESILELQVNGADLVETSLDDDIYSASIEREASKILKGLDSKWTVRVEIDLVWEQVPRFGIPGATNATLSTVKRSISIPLPLLHQDPAKP